MERNIRVQMVHCRQKTEQFAAKNQREINSTLDRVKVIDAQFVRQRQAFLDATFVYYEEDDDDGNDYDYASGQVVTNKQLQQLQHEL